MRLTGSVALENEEFATVARGAAWGLSGSLLVIVILLVLAVRSWRLVVPILLTLVLGLALTTGFAALAVGTLNLVSVAFAVLFVGIAVDFAIQFAVRFRAARGEVPTLADAVAVTGRRAGTQILVAAAATSAGFLAFTPTSFRGVAQLGFDRGRRHAGRLLLYPHGAAGRAGPAGQPRLRCRARGGRPRPARPARRAGPAAPAASAGSGRPPGLAGVAALPWMRFDGDPLNTKDPSTEAMRALRDLEDDPLTNPYSAEILVPSLDEAATVAARLRTLPLVDEVLTLHSLVPEDQDAKLPLVIDAAGLLAPTLSPRRRRGGRARRSCAQP